MNRFDRITALLIQLQSKKIIRAQELADRFGISLRTVYRDIRTLEEAGVPLYGEAGVGYSIVDGYRLPPVMFTTEEATAFITAEKLMGKFSDSTLQQHFSSAMFKVKAVLRGSEKELLENLDEQIIVKNKIRTHNNAPENTLDTLLKAIGEKKAVKMNYKAFGKENTERLIEPIGIFHEDEHWHTIAYCHLRENYRQFRTDRIVNISLTQQPQQERTTLKEYHELKEKVKASLTLQKVTLRIDVSIASYLQEKRHYYGFVSETVTANHIDMTFLLQLPDEGLLRWYIMFADHAEILEPTELQNDVNALIEKILQKNTVSRNLLT